MCTFLGRWAVLAAGMVTAAAVALGVVLTARHHSTHDTHLAHTTDNTGEDHDS